LHWHVGYDHNFPPRVLVDEDQVLKVGQTSTTLLFSPHFPTVKCHSAFTHILTAIYLAPPSHIFLVLLQLRYCATSARYCR
jgi:hypothetical protein